MRVEPAFRRRIQRTIARLEDDTGIDRGDLVRAALHRAPAARRRRGRRVGQGQALRPEADARQPGVPGGRRGEAEVLHAGRIVPVYRLTAGLTAARLRTAIREALDEAGHAYPEYLPDRDPRPRSGSCRSPGPRGGPLPGDLRGPRRRARAPGVRRAARAPAGMVARRRAAGPRRARRSSTLDDGRGRGRSGPRSSTRIGAQARAARSTLTDDQDVRDGRDPRRPRRGRRRCCACSRATSARARPRSRRTRWPRPRGPGCQGALLAPTDLLARQHVATVGALLEALGHRRHAADRLAQGRRAGARRSRRSRSGQAPVVVGTHALIQETVSFADLGLVVIDEQHRFGVEQRGRSRPRPAAASPHVLLMTATPIPRTLGQVLYADLDVSDLRTPPAGRVAIRTGIRRPDELDGHVGAGPRRRPPPATATFVVVPLIEEGADEAERRRRPAETRGRPPDARCSRRCGSGSSTAG